MTTRDPHACAHQPIPERHQQLVKECWPLACARWSRFLLLRQPVDAPGQHSIAQINLADRQVSIDIDAIEKKNLLGSMEAILAHEVGHHVKYPGSLPTQARLRLMEKSLLPYEHYSLINLFTDLLINEFLGRELQDQLADVYRSFATDLTGQDDTFLFYLAIYEALWQLPPGALMDTHFEQFQDAHPYHRAEATLLAQNIFRMGPNIFTQFLYFLSVMCRYIDHAAVREQAVILLVPCDCGGGDPSDEDWADALIPGAREREAIARALREGWISESDSDQLTDLENRIQSLPGQGTHNAERVPEIMASYYRREAEQYLFRPPPQPSYGEALVPTTFETWEAGDPIQHIDWRSTLQQFGPTLGAIQPLKRVQIPELEGYEVPMWRPRMEIYLDVSGSMPNPCRQRNAMTLAAQILTMATIRAGGWVRGLLYSTSEVTYWDWCRSEIEMSRFLMHYIGGGTQFPFHILESSVEECRHQAPIRVVISDWDFDYNYKENERHARIFRQACPASSPMILLLHLAEDHDVKHLQSDGAELIRIQELDDFPNMAAALSQTLFAHHQQHVVP
jgi:hypothetical protein